MEPRREEPTAPTPQPQEKPRRFRIVKLEERIAPSKGGAKLTKSCTYGCCGQLESQASIE
jgi:hypothetical protein